jgi:teichuronic acid biosynthesis glycosyltransferase TuaC
VLKIAVVTRYFPSSAEPWQGRSAYQTLRVLARVANVQVFYPSATYPAQLKPRTRTYDKLDPSYCPPDVPVHYYNFPALPLISRPLNGWMASRVLLPHVRNFAPDLIFGYFLYPDSFAAVQIGKALSVPVVAMGIGSDLNNIRDRITYMYTRSVVRKADFVVTKTEDLRRKAARLGAPPEKTRVVPNGCDLSTFHVSDRIEARHKLGLDPNVQTIVYIGRMDVKKGLRELVEAVASMHRQRPNLQLYMVGAGPDRSLIESAITAHKAATYIHAMPACSFEEVATWMAAANLITLPSYMEGCPNVVLEALACGRPVVATNVGGIPEIMSDAGGRLVPPRNPAELAHALESVLDATWDASAISAHWSRSWNTVAGELLSIFEALVSKHQAAIHGQ